MPLNKVKAFLDTAWHEICRHLPFQGVHRAGHCSHLAHIRPRAGQDGHRKAGWRLGHGGVAGVVPGRPGGAAPRYRSAGGGAGYRTRVQTAFPDCETGAMPPFGNLYGIPVYVDETLLEDREIAFNAGSHFELIKMAYKDFERLVKPEVMEFSSARVAHVLV